MKFLIATILLLFTFFVAHSQQAKTFDVVPKSYSFEVGTRYNFQNSFGDIPEIGYSALFDYAWQLSGFLKKMPSSISVPLGYTYFPATNSNISDFSLLSYGWTVKHQLVRDKKVIPYLGYSLLLNQMKIFGETGSVMGHKTGMGFGLIFNTSPMLKPYLRFEYSLTRFAMFGNKGGERLQGVELCLGLRIK